MNKRYICIISVLIFSAVFLVIFVLNANYTKELVEETHEKFSLDEYNSVISNYTSNRKLGPTLTGIDAMDKAKQVWLELYDKQRVESVFPFCQVKYDSQNEVWLVKFAISLPDDLVDSSSVVVHRGSSMGILIQKSDGKVLAVWSD